MNIFKEYMADVYGVEIFAILSLAIFLVVFIVMVVQTFSIRKKAINEYKNIPLDEDPDDESEKKKHNQ